MNSVSFCEKITTINLQFIGVVRQAVSDDTSLGPLSGFSKFRRILYGYIVSQTKRRERFGVRRELFLFQQVPFRVSLLTLVSFKPPLSPWLELLRLERQMIPQASSKDDLCGAEARDRVSLIVMDEEGTGYTVSVQGSTGRNVVQDESFSRLDGYLCTFVSSGIIVGGDSVADTISSEECLHVMTDEH